MTETPEPSIERHKREHGDEWLRLSPEPVPNIYSALEGVSSALTSTLKLLERAVNDWERREEELRDAHLDLANALNRRMDELHTRVDELESAA